MYAHRGKPVDWSVILDANARASTAKRRHGRNKRAQLVASRTPARKVAAPLSPPAPRTKAAFGGGFYARCMQWTLAGSALAKEWFGGEQRIWRTAISAGAHASGQFQTSYPARMIPSGTKIMPRGKRPIASPPEA